MENSTLRIETLALHVELKASLPMDDLVSPTVKMEVAAWKQLEGCYRVVDVGSGFVCGWMRPMAEWGE